MLEGNSGGGSEHTYNTSFPIFALSFSNQVLQRESGHQDVLMGIGSFVDGTNCFQLLQLNDESGIHCELEQHVNFPLTKIMWVPGQNAMGPDTDLFATSSDVITLWKVEHTK